MKANGRSKNTAKSAVESGGSSTWPLTAKHMKLSATDLSLNNVTDSEAFPGLIRQTHRKIRSAAADGAYDTRLCHDELRRKKISAFIPPRKGAGYWPGEYAARNRAVANQRMSGSNARWKWTTEYNRRSIAETAMYRVKQLFGGSLTLRDYDRLGNQCGKPACLFDGRFTRSRLLNLFNVTFWHSVFCRQGIFDIRYLPLRHKSVPPAVAGRR